MNTIQRDLMIMSSSVQKEIRRSPKSALLLSSNNNKKVCRCSSTVDLSFEEDFPFSELERRRKTEHPELSNLHVSGDEAFQRRAMLSGLSLPSASATEGAAFAAEAAADAAEFGTSLCTQCQR